MASEGSCEIKPGCSSWPAGEDGAGADQPGPGAGENGVAANPEHINLKVLFNQFSEENWPHTTIYQVMGQDGNIVQFKIKKHTALKKLMSTYCERAGLDLQVAFFYQIDLS